MGMPEIQEAPRPSNPWVPMGATVVETGTDALGSLGNRSQGIAFMNGSWMSREVHVQFWERVGVKFPCATHLPAIIAKFGGKVLARGGRYQILEGPAKFHRFVVIEFPTFEQGVACFTSPEYDRAAAFRRNGAGEVETIMVEGGDPTR